MVKPKYFSYSLQHAKCSVTYRVKKGRELSYAEALANQLFFSCYESYSTIFHNRTYKPKFQQKRYIAHRYDHNRCPNIRVKHDCKITSN